MNVTDLIRFEQPINPYLIGILLLGVFILLCIAYLCFRDTLLPQVIQFSIGEEMTTTSSKIKLLQVSDLHIKKVDWMHRRLLKKINHIQPDILLLTGDVVFKDPHLKALDTWLAKVDNRIQVVGIWGNWEYGKPIVRKKIRALYQKHNSLLLVNQSQRFQFRDKTVTLTGMDDWVAGKPNFRKAIKGFERDRNIILLAHCPVYRDTLVQEVQNITKETAHPLDIRCVLSGHTHGGQIKLFRLIPYLPMGSGQYLSGWYKEAFPPLFVSKGLGTSKFPLRFGARAEVVLFEV